LGAMIMDVTALVTSLEKIRKDQFYYGQNQIVYEALQTLHGENIAIDVATIANQLEKMGQVATIGGLEYIAELIDAVPTVAHLEYYIDILLQNAIRREMLGVGQAILKEALNA